MGHSIFSGIFIATIMFLCTGQEFVMASDGGDFVMQGAGTKMAHTNGSDFLVLNVTLGPSTDYVASPGKNFTFTVGTYNFRVQAYAAGPDILYKFKNEEGIESNAASISQLEIKLIGELYFDGSTTKPLAGDKGKFDWDENQKIVKIGLSGDDIPKGLVLKAQNAKEYFNDPTPQPKSDSSPIFLSFGLFAFVALLNLWA